MHKEEGFYTCAGCGNKLFSSDSKFDSHCGWPSFDKQVDSKAIKTIDDNTHGMRRTEILCGKCGGHLGHIFDDGPTDTGMRYCVNSLSLSFEKETENTNMTNENSMDTLTLGGGCFWCIETIFQEYFRCLVTPRIRVNMYLKSPNDQIHNPSPKFDQIILKKDHC